MTALHGFPPRGRPTGNLLVLTGRAASKLADEIRDACVGAWRAHINRVYAIVVLQLWNSEALP